jgi:hypothetical protein
MSKRGSRRAEDIVFVPCTSLQVQKLFNSGVGGRPVDDAKSLLSNTTVSEAVSDQPADGLDNMSKALTVLFSFHKLTLVGSNERRRVTGMVC